MVHDALQLAVRCDVDRAAPTPRALPPTPPSPAAAAASTPEFFVSTASGSDSAAGTVAAPFATPQRGVEACRAASGGGDGCTVTLRGGTYFLAGRPLQLTAADNGLTLRSYAGERAELSGGEPLTGLSWTLANVTGRAGTAVVWAAPFQSADQLTALRVKGSGRRVTRARHPNVDPETLGARRNGQGEGWVPAAGADWYPAPAGPTPGQDFVSGAMDWPGVDWSHHLQMASAALSHALHLA